MPYCCAFGCTNHSGKVTGKSFYQIPNPQKEKERASRWIHNIGNAKINIKTFISCKDKVVCSDHFHENCIQRDLKYELGLKSKTSKLLIDGSVPTIFKHKVYDEINMDGTKIIRKISASRKRKQIDERKETVKTLLLKQEYPATQSSNSSSINIQQLPSKSTSPYHPVNISRYVKSGTIKLVNDSIEHKYKPGTKSVATNTEVAYVESSTQTEDLLLTCLIHSRHSRNRRYNNY